MSRNLVYTCCFYQEGYVDVVKNLIDTALPQLDTNTDFLVYTTSQLKEKMSGLDSRVLFFEKNFYKTMNQARISKMDIFDYPEIDKYEKIIYLDADSYVMGPVSSMFNAIQEDVVYTVGEGNIMCEAEYWGRSLFLRENADYADREGMGAYVLGFKNLQAIKKMFIKIKQAFYLDMYQNKLRFYDQPFINFYLIHNNMFDSQTFKKYVKSRPSAEDAVKLGLSVVHFSGCPGHANVKLDLINDFKNQLSSVSVPETASVSVATASALDTRYLHIRKSLNEMKAMIAHIESLL